MTETTLAHIKANPKYRELVGKRNRFALVLSILMLLVYYGFIALVAFDKELLGHPIGDGMTTTLGIPLGLGVIVFTILITGFYVNRANGEFDTLTEEVLREAGR